MTVHGTDPLVEELALRLVLERVLPLRLEDQRFAGTEPNEEVGAVLPDNAIERVDNLEAEVVVLHPPLGNVIPTDACPGPSSLEERLDGLIGKAPNRHCGTTVYLL